MERGAAVNTVFEFITQPNSSDAFPMKVIMCARSVAAWAFFTLPQNRGTFKL